MSLTAYVVDAFTDRVFQGNPAAVIPLQHWLADELMQSIAAEHNIAETVFFVPIAGGYHIRWFTPVAEIDLCGHATLASAFVLKRFIVPALTKIAFESKSGPLGVEIAGDLYTLDFPSRPPTEVAVSPYVSSGLKLPAQQILAARDYFAIYASEEELRSLDPDMGDLSRIDRLGVIATAPSSQTGIDFVSRFFAPATGIPEDPVTGSAHSTLIPYWAARLGKAKMRAKQISPRGGDLECELAGDRVRIGGHAVLYSKNEIYIPG